MMFRRRKKLHIGHRMRELVWPRAGWRRASRYLMHRAFRLSDTPYAIAAGLACGAAISFTPFIGFHFLLSALLAWIIGGNILASAVGTVVGNPWTFPFIWLWTYRFGSWMLGGDAAHHLPVDLSFTYMLDHPLQVLLPMTVGAIPTAIVVWAIAYWPLSRAIARYQARRIHLRSRGSRGGRGRHTPPGPKAGTEAS